MRRKIALLTLVITLFQQSVFADNIILEPIPEPVPAPTPESSQDTTSQEQADVAEQDFNQNKKEEKTSDNVFVEVASEEQLIDALNKNQSSNIEVLVKGDITLTKSLVKNKDTHITFRGTNNSTLALKSKQDFTNVSLHDLVVEVKDMSSTVISTSTPNMNNVTLVLEDLSDVTVFDLASKNNLTNVSVKASNLQDTKLFNQMRETDVTNLYMTLKNVNNYKTFESAQASFDGVCVEYVSQNQDVKDKHKSYLLGISLTGTVDKFELKDTNGFNPKDLNILGSLDGKLTDVYIHDKVDGTSLGSIVNTLGSNSIVDGFTTVNIGSVDDKYQGFWGNTLLLDTVNVSEDILNPIVDDNVSLLQNNISLKDTDDSGVVTLDGTVSHEVKTLNPTDKTWNAVTVNKDITVVQPYIKDYKQPVKNDLIDTYTVDWGSEDLVFDNLGNVELETTTPNILSIKGKAVSFLDVGKGMLDVKSNETTKSITINVTPTKEYEWMNDVKNITKPLTHQHFNKIKQLDSILNSDGFKKEIIPSDILDLFLTYKKSIPVNDDTGASNNLQDSKVVADMIDELPVPELIKWTDVNTVRELVRAVEDLDLASPDGKDKIITDRHRSKLDECMIYVREWEVADEEVLRWVTQVKLLPPVNELKLSDELNITNLINIYTGFKDKTRELAHSKYIDSLNYLKMCERKLLELKEDDFKRIAENFVNKVNEFEWDLVTSKDLTRLESLVKEYKEMISDVRKYVPNAIVTKLDELLIRARALIHESNLQTANRVSILISGLPEPNVITLSHVTVVNDVSLAYDTLTQEQKELVPNVLRVKLEKCKAELNNLTGMSKDVESLVKEIDTLYNLDSLSSENITRIYELHKYITQTNTHLVRVLPSDTLGKLNTLKERADATSNTTVKSPSNDVIVSGFIGSNPKFSAIRLSQNYSTYSSLNIPNLMSSNFGMDYIDGYDLVLETNQGTQPLARLTVKIPAPYVKDYVKDLSLFMYDKDTKSLNKVEFSLEVIDGKTYAVTHSNKLGIFVFGTSRQPFKWIFQFTGKGDKIPTNDMVNNSNVTTDKINPQTGKF